LAAREGASITQAVERALDARLAALEERAERRRWAARPILEEIWALPVHDDRPPDEMLYDADGNPRPSAIAVDTSAIMVLLRKPETEAVEAVQGSSDSSMSIAPPALPLCPAGGGPLRRVQRDAPVDRDPAPHPRADPHHAAPAPDGDARRGLIRRRHEVGSQTSSVPGSGFGSKRVKSCTPLGV
jgi:hypothetical protein